MGTGEQEEASNLAAFSGTQVSPLKSRSHMIRMRSEPGIWLIPVTPALGRLWDGHRGMEETVWMVAKAQDFIGFATR